MPVIEANGIHFNVQVKGEGLPLVMVHGAFVGSLASWYLTVAPALYRKHRVVLYDLRGHGKSDRPISGYDAATMAADLDAVASASCSAPFALVGHSYGALVAMRYTLDHPEKVTRLSILDAPLPPGEMRTFEEFLRRTPEELIASLPPATRLMVRLGGRRVTKFIESIQFLAFETNLTKDILAASEISDEALGTINCPVLCIYGENSPCLPAGQRLRAAIPSSRLEIVPGGHFVHVDAKKQVAQNLLEFLDG
jgi:esterase